MRFQERPNVIEAVQYFSDMGTYTCEVPQWLITACSDGTVFCVAKSTFLKTSEGPIQVHDGDWIIRGWNGGGFYAYSPDEFEKRYEKCAP